MNDASAPATPMTHWLIAGAGLIWNLFGLMIFISTVRATPEQLAAAYSDVEVAFIQSIPFWAHAANAIAVLAGIAGCVLLLLRKALALQLFIVSLAAVLIQDLHSFVIVDVTAVFGMVPAYIQGTVLVIAVALIFYARSAKNKGLLR